MKNKGIRQYRFKDNPLERCFAEKWDSLNSNVFNGRLDGRGLLDYIMAHNLMMPNGEVSDRDRVVAATVIQWLGSPVGQDFLDNCMGK